MRLDRGGLRRRRCVVATGRRCCLQALPPEKRLQDALAATCSHSSARHSALLQFFRALVCVFFRGESLRGGFWQAEESNKARESLGAKLRAALREEMALVERVQALEADVAAAEARAAEVAGRAGELEAALARSRSEAAGLGEERAGLASRMQRLEEEVLPLPGSDVAFDEPKRSPLVVGFLAPFAYRDLTLRVGQAEGCQTLADGLEAQLKAALVEAAGLAGKVRRLEAERDLRLGTLAEEEGSSSGRLKVELAECRGEVTALQQTLKVHCAICEQVSNSHFDSNNF